MKTSILFIGILLLAFTACKKSADYEALIDSGYEDVPLITTVSLEDSLAKGALGQLGVQQLHGIKVEHASGDTTSYFAYRTDAVALLRRISALPFRRGQQADTLCRVMPQPFSTAGLRLLSGHERQASAFFWPIDPSQYIHYECIKGRQRHTILVSRLDNTVLHRIERKA
jgi:hypothetical protein